MPTTNVHNDTAADSADQGTEVVKWYTRARRFPQLIGKTADGRRIWGGPYTYTQVGVGVGTIVIGSKTTWLWGQFGIIGNAVILLLATYGLVLVVGRLPVGSRNLLAVGAGALRALSSPRQGRVAGSPVRLRRPHRVPSRVIVTPLAPVRPHGSLAMEPRPSDIEHAAPTTPAPERTVALTGVQRLLASTGPTHQED